MQALEVSSFVGHISYVLILMSYMVRKIFILRLMAIMASFFAIFYNYVFLPNPLWVSIQWNSLFIAINSIHLALLMWEKRQFQFKGDENFLYKNVFSHLSPGELKKIISLGEIKRFNSKEILIEEGKRLDELFLLIDGQLSIRSHGFEIATLEPKSFAGEMSFLTGDKTRAFVLAKRNSRLFVWRQMELKCFLEKTPCLQQKFHMALGSQLINQLMNVSFENARIKDKLIKEQNKNYHSTLRPLL